MHFPAIAKITRPPGADRIVRERLFRLITGCRGDKNPDRQAAGPGRPITWVTGPAGCGKTTLVNSYLERCDHFQLWYRLDDNDNDIATLFYYLRLAAGEQKVLVDELLQPTPECPLGLETFTRRYFESFYRLIPRPAIIVFDNFEEIAPESPFLSMFRLALEVLPPGVSIIVISRRQPPPHFARFRALQTMGVVGWDELRFTPEESRALLTTNEEWRFAPTEIETICEQTGGWVAGLVLLAEKLKNEPSREEPVRIVHTEEIFNYFANETLAAAAEELRSFMLATAFLPEMTPRTAKELTGGSAATILERLYQNHFFIERRRGREPIYSYHSLFGKFLRLTAAEVLTAAQLQAIKLKAAAILVDEETIEPAVELLLEAEALDELALLLQRRGLELLARGRQQVIIDWLGGLPEERRRKNPILLYWCGLAGQFSDPAGARRELEVVFSHCAEGDPLKFLAWSAIVDGFRFEWDDFTPLRNWIAWLDEARARGVACPSPQAEARVASSMAAALMIARPDHPEISYWIQRATEEARDHPDITYRVSSYSYIVNYFYWVGDLEAAAVLLEEIRQLAQNSGASPLIRLIWFWLEAAIAVWLESDYEGALNKVAEALKYAEETGIHIWDQPLLAVGGYAALSHGDIRRARGFIGRIAAGLNPNRRHMVGQYHYLEAWSAMVDGKLAKARVQGEVALRFTRATGYVFPQIIVLLGLVWILLEIGDLRKARDFLQEAEELSRRTGSRTFRYGCLMARARLEFLAGDEREASAALAQALRLGREQGVYNLFWIASPAALASLCAEALTRGIEIEQAGMIIKKCRLVPPALLKGKAATDWPYPLAINTMGGFTLIRDGVPLVFAGKTPRKPLEMLKILIAMGDRGVKEERLSDFLWPDADGDAAHKSFEVNLARLRKLLGGRSHILYHHGQVEINPDGCRVDVVELEMRLREAEKAWEEADRVATRKKASAAAPAARLSELAVSRFQGDFLPTHEESWAAICRDRIRARVLVLLARLGAYHHEAGCLEAALAAYRRGLEIDELNEEFHRRSMVCHSRLGQKAEAVAAYRRCRRALAGGLGISPSDQTEALYTQICRAS
ncbi:BTAD domain-containing putative transcriptional regulator [Desulfurivibrio dismutans]|uniref:BTAD domain-containing putative transcriptional regulator n=1 Tax=Desulfurivibrio dismutans TaxID=1398908 RepID=UPI0023DB25E3|nr:BTAD domain-containing putative transcriptional regulator [Desulfurivibrio alkaliphilus]MDF1615501.1 BTAD domain-containing putative transcriptional regulator [Desulfurivibrio alkaliphilus]